MRHRIRNCLQRDVNVSGRVFFKIGGPRPEKNDQLIQEIGDADRRGADDMLTPIEPLREDCKLNLLGMDFRLLDLFK